jgi:hypothetical protein
MSGEENKALIRRYIAALDDNDSSDWSIIDEFVADDFVAHNPPLPGVSLDRDGLKQAAEIFRLATPGTHDAEGDLVVSRHRRPRSACGRAARDPASNREIESEARFAASVERRLDHPLARRLD